MNFNRTREAGEGQDGSHSNKMMMVRNRFSWNHSGRRSPFPTVFSGHRVADRLTGCGLTSPSFCIRLCVCPQARTTPCRLCHFVMRSAARKLMPPALLFQIRMALAILGLLWLHLHFRICFYFCKRYHWDFDKYSTESTNPLGYVEISTIKVFQSTDMDVCPFIYVFIVFH